MGGKDGVYLVNSRVGVEGVSRLTVVPPTNVSAQLTAGLWAGLLLVSASDSLSHGPPLDPESPGVHGGGNVSLPPSSAGRKSCFGTLNPVWSPLSNACCIEKCSYNLGV